MNPFVCDKCGYLPPGPFKKPPSPVPHLLFTNLSPSLTEIDAINHTLSDIQDIVTSLDQSIARASHLLETLVNKRRELEEYAAEHTRVFSPARHLYPDILSEIFLRCEKGARSPQELYFRAYDTPLSFSPTSGPLILSQICRMWREAALATPILWTLIRLSMKPMRAYPQSQLALVRTWLARSGTCPLTICIVDNRLGAPPDGADVNLIFHTLIEQSHRWQNLRLLSAADTLVLFGTIVERLNLPQLQALTLCLTREADFHLLQTSPQLRTLYLGCNSSTTDSLRIPGHLGARLRRVELSVMGKKTVTSIRLCLEILLQLPELEEYHARCNDRIPDPLIIQLAVHHRLRSLNIIADLGTLNPLFERLTVPSLHDLRLEMHSHQRWIQPQLMVGFLSRTPSLKRFSVDTQKVVSLEEDLIQCFRHMPIVTHLELNVQVTSGRGKPLTDNILRRLVLSDRDVDLMPRLQSIEIRGHTDFSAQCISDLVRSRQKSNANDTTTYLQSVALQSRSPQ